ncbi:MAG: FKBP-type peptidyl-prolyl cis-trans isomerase [Bacteroidota bacterium]
MKRKNKVWSAGVLMLLVLVSCRTPVQDLREKEEDPVKEKLISANQYMSERHQDQISAFVERMGWSMEQTSTGLWFMLTKHGDGRPIGPGETIEADYTVRLLDGTLCYTGGKEKPRTLTLGKGEVEAGLEEALLLMHHGDQARIIIPPHLAHGNFGDRNKIPGASVIMYDISVH